MTKWVGHGWKVHSKEETILMLGLKYKQMGIHEMEGKMCKGNDILQKVKWHGVVRKKISLEKKKGPNHRQA